MASPILLGSTPMLRHGMGADGRNNQGGTWSGTFGVGFTNLWTVTPSIAHPDGGVFYGRACFVCYGPAGSTIEGCVQIDGGGLVGYGRLFFNAQVFTLFTFTWNSNPWGRMAPGAHSINIGVYCEGGQVIFDSNCGGEELTEEMPA